MSQRTRSHLRASPLAQDPEEERASEEGGDDTDRELGGSDHRPSSEVADRKEASPEQRTGRNQPMVSRPNPAARQMGYHQTDEADRAGHGDQRPDAERGTTE